MSDRSRRELPPDDELGMAGMDLNELAKLLEDEPAPPPPSKRGRSGDVPGGRPGSWGLGFLTLLVLLFGAWAASEKRVLPDTTPANVPDSVFSSGRAMAQLVEMARAPRPVGSPEHTRVREMIMDRLEALGLEPEIHASMAIRRQAQDVRAVTLRNIVARIPGTASTGAVLLTAHYDAVPLSMGAGDDGTGVVAILEAVRALRSGPPLENDVIVLITDGEEIGLLGARAFVEEHRWMDDVSVVLGVEMRGGGGPVHMFETGAENGWIVRAMRDSDPRPLASSLSVEVYRRLPNDTDFTAFRQAGVQGLNFAGIGRAWVYHQPTDVPMNIQEGTLQHHGMRILAITRELGRRDLSSVNAPDVIFTTLPVVGIVAYPEEWALPISGGILLLWIGALAVTLVKGARWTGVATGLGVMVVAGLGAWGLGWSLMAWLPRFHPEYGSMTPAFYGEGWYVLGLAAGALALTTLLLGLARTRFSVAALAVGATFAPVAAAVGLAMVAPLAVFEFQIPALAGVLAAVVAALGGSTRPERELPGWARLLALLLALPVLAMMVPLFEGLWISMSFRMAAALGALVVVALACLVPALDGLGAPNRLWMPLVGAVAGVLFLGGGILKAGPSPDRPVPSTLVYALDREGGEAVWATRDDPGFRWAEGNVGPFTGERDLARFLIPASYRTVWAPPANIPEPTVRFMGPTPDGPPGVVRLGLASEAEAELISLIVREDEGSIVAVSGRPVPLGEPGAPGARRAVTRMNHQGVAEGDLTVDIAVESGVEALYLAVVEQHLRPWEYVGSEPFERPRHVMPSPQGRSDRALIRTPIRIRLDEAPAM